MNKMAMQDEPQDITTPPIKAMEVEIPETSPEVLDEMDDPILSLAKLERLAEANLKVAEANLSTMQKNGTLYLDRKSFVRATYICAAASKNVQVIKRLKEDNLGDA
jgi:hypothetical protein